MFENFRFVFFDVGSTLLFADRDRMLKPLYARGIRPSEAELRAMECRVKNEFDRLMEHGGKPDYGFGTFYARLFGELDLQDEGLRKQLIANTRLSMNWNRMRPGTRNALQNFGAHYQVAVIRMPMDKLPNCWPGAGLRIVSRPSRIRAWSDMRSRTR